MKEVLLVDRVFENISEIEEYSISTLGINVADKYLDDMESGLNLLQKKCRLISRFRGIFGQTKILSN